jgi:hypothetical protein
MNRKSLNESGQSLYVMQTLNGLRGPVSSVELKMLGVDSKMFRTVPDAGLFLVFFPFQILSFSQPFCCFHKLLSSLCFRKCLCLSCSRRFRHGSVFVRMLLCTRHPFAWHSVKHNLQGFPISSWCTAFVIDEAIYILYKC